MLQDVARVLRRLLPENITLRLNHPATLPVIADASTFEQLVTNLVKNAGDSMPRGGVVTVHLSAAAHGEGVVKGPWTEVELLVSDEGPGVSDAVRERMFEPFFTTRAQGRGTGLGLAIVHGIAAQLRGRVEVDSAPGGGTTFRVVLRMQQSGLAPEEKAPVGAPCGSLRLLVVEDQELVRRSTVRLLTSAGHEASDAENGQAALDLIDREEPFDLIVSDVVMPVLGGLEMVETLRDGGNRVPVLLVTGYAAPLDAEHELPAHVRVLTKPFTAQQLSEAMQDLVAASRPRDVAHQG